MTRASAEPRFVVESADLRLAANGDEGRFVFLRRLHELCLGVMEAESPYPLLKGGQMSRHFDLLVGDLAIAFAPRVAAFKSAKPGFAGESQVG